MMYLYACTILSLLSFGEALRPFYRRDAAASAVCNILIAQYPRQVTYGLPELNATLSIDYGQARNDYWSQANSDLKPACVFFPTNAEEVAFAVKALGKHEEARWAVKGAGHNANTGYAATDGGVLISLRQGMETARLDTDTMLAHVRPGCRWMDVFKVLDPYHRAVVSGRLGVVGVPGLTLGGGLSFMSTEHGMVADNVVSYEAVLANGEIITADAQNNSDIFFALKGGGNQFAIVTEFRFRTYPVGQVWGGYKIYSKDKKDALLDAVQELTATYNDPKAAVIVTFSTTLDALIDIFVVFHFYNDPNGPGEILKKFDGIPALIDATKTRSLLDLLKSNSKFSLEGSRYVSRTSTLPNLPGLNGTSLYSQLFDDWYKEARNIQLAEPDNYVFSMAFQPVPHQLAQASINNPSGVNLLGLDPNHGDKVFMEYTASYLSSSSDQSARDHMIKLVDTGLSNAQEGFAGLEPTNYKSGDLKAASYQPLFMNDAMYDQDVFASYGSANHDKLVQIQRERDPKGFFAKRTGGFKVN